MRSDDLKIADDQTLDALVEAAGKTPRRRLHRNFHDSYDDPCQRLLNAVEPESYIRPHRHLTPPKSETFLVLRGSFAVILFEDGGEIVKSVLLSSQGAALADIAPGAWHSVVSLESGSVFFETKPGPYVALSDKDWAPWAPLEGTPEAVSYLEELKAKLNKFGEWAGPPGKR